MKYLLLLVLIGLASCHAPVRKDRTVHALVTPVYGAGSYILSIDSLYRVGDTISIQTTDDNPSTGHILYVVVKKDKI